MAYVQPNSTIKIFAATLSKPYPVPFDPNYENTIIFDSIAAQTSYFDEYGYVSLGVNSYTRVNDGVIKVGIKPVSGLPNDNTIAQIYCANYMAFKNTSFENKWFYAFIDRVEYVNNNCAEVYFHLDVIQSYMFNWTFDECLIEREHTTSDVIGEHTVPEQLETGPYRSYPAQVYLEDSQSPTGLAYMYNRFEYQACIILACALDNHDLEQFTYGTPVPGIAAGTGKYYSGVRYYAYRMYGGGEEQGIYQFNFAGNWAYGEHVVFDGSNIFLTAEAATNDNTLALYIADFINQYSTSYSANRTDWGVITVYEKTGHFGVGIPTVTTDSANGQIYPYTVQEGSSGDEYGDIHKLNRALQTINENAKSDAIVGLFMMPLEFYPKTTDELLNGVPPLNMRVIAPSTLDMLYVPRNKKLFCYPYNMMYVTNNVGNSAEYHYEDFIRVTSAEGDYCRFKIWGNISMNPGIYCAPHYYNGNTMATGATDDELTISGFPMCSYNIDSYKAWLSQNAGTITATGVGLAAGWVTAIGGAALAGAGLVGTGAATASGYVGQHLALSGAEQAMANRMAAGVQMPGSGLIAGTLGALGQLYDHSRRPPQIHGQNNGNLAYQAGQLTFSWYHKQIKEEYAQMIDAFFDMYGYKTNRVGTPNLRARPCYTYVKTIGCSIKGYIPNDLKREIEAIFDKGIRFWRPTATYGSFDPAVNDNQPT